MNLDHVGGGDRCQRLRRCQCRRHSHGWCEHAAGQREREETGEGNVRFSHGKIFVASGEYSRIGLLMHVLPSHPSPLVIVESIFMDLAIIEPLSLSEEDVASCKQEHHEM